MPSVIPGSALGSPPPPPPAGGVLAWNTFKGSRLRDLLTRHQRHREKCGAASAGRKIPVYRCVSGPGIGSVSLTLSDSRDASSFRPLSMSRLKVGLEVNQKRNGFFLTLIRTPEPTAALLPGTDYCFLQSRTYCPSHRLTHTI